MNNPLDPTLREANDCGCCAGTEAQTPAAIYNRPGLPEIAFRAGEYSHFKATLLAGLSASADPALRALRSRDGDDFTIALLDAFAGMADVLTFYSERIANEAFLRTATERRSVLELARAIGYALSPGLAASVRLAFTIEGGRGAPGMAIIPKGTKVQSLPGPEETPQVFETTVEFQGRAAWNELRPRLRAAPLENQSLIDLPIRGPLYLAGTGTNLRKGDVLVLSGGDNAKAVARRVAEVSVDRERNHTRVSFEAPGETTPSQPPESNVVTLVESIELTARAAPSHDVYAHLIADRSLSSEFVYALIDVHGWDPDALQTHLNTRPRVVLSGPSSGVFALRERVGFFGHNAPKHATLPPEFKGAYLNDWDNHEGHATTIWQDSQGKELPVTTGFDVLLERVVPEVRPDGWLVLESAHRADLKIYRIGQAAELSRTDYAMSTRCTALQFPQPDPGVALEKGPEYRTRTSTAHLRSESLDVIGAPIETDLEAGQREIELDSFDPDLRVGQFLVLQGEDANLSRTRVREFVQIGDIRHRDVTTLILRSGLTHRYVRATVTLNANVVPATHGETVKEVLGSGDVRQPHQALELRQTPLTYTLPPEGGLPESSLEVWVDEVRWAEVSSLHHLGPEDRAYVVHHADEGTSSIQFGDGRRGVRLPSGRENVRAVYRKGTGLAGQVKAGQLSLLLTQPLGVKAVTNPLQPEGAEDRQTLARARENAPRTVLTLDRIVSLQDYEDYARDFPGVDRAHAAWTWNRDTRGIMLSLLGPAAAMITADGPTARSLVSTLHRLGDPHVPIQILPGMRSLFTLYGTVRVAANRSAERVGERVRSSLRERFSFESRDFGQGVALSEVIAVIQGVDGVESVDLDKIKKRVLGPFGVRTYQSKSSYVPAHTPQDGAAAQLAQPAELLVLDERTFHSTTFTIV